jgi:2-acylglycerol O-acyltransferase 2
MSSEWEPSESNAINGHEMPSKSYAEAAVEPPPAPKTNGSLEVDLSQINGNLPVKSPGEYVGKGILDAPTSPIRGHKRLGSRSSRSSLKTNSVKKKSSSDESELVHERYQDGKGGILTSLRSTEDYHLALEQDAREKKRHSSSTQEQELASGRVAAAGWERSGLVDTHPANAEAG